MFKNFCFDALHQCRPRGRKLQRALLGARTRASNCIAVRLHPSISGQVYTAKTLLNISTFATEMLGDGSLSGA
jgi:hypothetical protein